MAVGMTDQGVPLTDGEGKELCKNQTMKVQKEWIVQRKPREEYLPWKKGLG
jgi:cysteinyl-tRNA synthetase